MCISRILSRLYPPLPPPATRARTALDIPYSDFNGFPFKFDHMKNRIKERLGNFEAINLIIDASFDDWRNTELRIEQARLDEFTLRSNEATNDSYKKEVNEFLQNVEDRIYSNCAHIHQAEDIRRAIPAPLELSHRFSTNRRLEYNQAEIEKVKDIFKKFKPTPDEFLPQKNKAGEINPYDKYEYRLLQKISKELAHLLTGNSTIELNIKIGGQTVLVEYQIEEIPIWWGLCAYGFTAKNNENAPPILVFHQTKTSPTEVSSGLTIIEDINPFGVGYFSAMFGHANVRRWLEIATNNGAKKALGAGYSFGGALLTNFFVLLYGFFERGYTYNAPGVGFLMERKWKVLPQDPPKLFNFDDKNGWVEFMGQVKIGQNYYIRTEERAGHSATTAELHHIADRAGERIMKIHPYIQIAVCSIVFPIALSLLALKRFTIGHQHSKTFLLYPFYITALKIEEVVIRALHNIKQKMDEWSLLNIPEHIQNGNIVLTNPLPIGIRV